MDEIETAQLYSQGGGVKKVGSSSCLCVRVRGGGTIFKLCESNIKSKMIDSKVGKTQKVSSLLLATEACLKLLLFWSNWACCGRCCCSRFWM